MTRAELEAADDAGYEDFRRMKAEAARRVEMIAMAEIVAQAIFGWVVAGSGQTAQSGWV